MRIYMFKSESRQLRAFAGDVVGAQLPERHGPWVAAGVVAANREAPHNLSRSRIEKAIANEGFQLWRLRGKAGKSKAN